MIVLNMIVHNTNKFILMNNGAFYYCFKLLSIIDIPHKRGSRNRILRAKPSAL